MALSNYRHKRQIEAAFDKIDAENDNNNNKNEEIVKYTSSNSRELQTWPSSFEKPSDLYRKVVVNSHHPPLMQFRSWNLAVPYKEQQYAHTPSESIANNYTPTASELKLKFLSHKKLRNSYQQPQNEPSEFRSPRFNRKDVKIKKYALNFLSLLKGNILIKMKILSKLKGWIHLLIL
jgi:hypothetical protein